MVDPPPLHRPVEGPVASRFTYDRAAPFRPGRRRIVRLVAPAGSRVRSPCRGRVTYAGRVPGATAGGVSVRCGAWSATLTGVDPRVVRGRRVGRGVTVARATGAPVGLGLRLATDRFGYVDPLPLLRSPPPGRPFVPVGPAPRARPPAPVAAPAARPATAPVARPATAPAARPATTPVARPAPAPGAALARLAVPASSPVIVPVERPGTPVVAWVGLALAALGIPVGALRLGGRRLTARRPAPSTSRVRTGHVDI